MTKRRKKAEGRKTRKKGWQRRSRRDGMKEMGREERERKRGSSEGGRYKYEVKNKEKCHTFNYALIWNIKKRTTGVGTGKYGMEKYV